MVLTKIHAGFEHARIKNIDYNVSKYFLLGSIIGVVIFAGGINYIISHNIIKI
ncbi:hypothetical protein MNB_ARC-1_837 [hydrothermal vent metagenome]|uniref:Uncharacterized protein n=1 Tax=hydrothermal vent metagenome TaxID=652676 RepID=A0A3B1E598_9ZZZZ